ncbi:pyocin R2_PP, tail formation protein [Pseudomonas knackmussii B13]|uniref:Pyocin R2_PP, tail formation protein n=1 Tax=Pseudomonas knackmussii (strain DSM 6978 / CCUG 54928 / LMG 23759 / B13) TaxID=1301098 RepID=A0A024HAP1_PSEKB|nr:phage tail protein [Pseudomonas knackmussii]CDF81956.1 pyocin R2_PP, tail formation protein [Pseudomonas knackmussii B13]
MAYTEQLQAALKSIGEAIESRHQDLSKKVSPVDAAIGELQAATAELEKQLGLPPDVSSALQRVMRGIDQANAKLDKVVGVFSKAERQLHDFDERIDKLKNQAQLVGKAINKLAGAISPAMGDIIPSAWLAGASVPEPAAITASPHLLVMRPLAPTASAFYFNLSTAAFDKLVRDTQYSWAAQPRLGLSPALQFTGQGAETLTLSGTIAPLLGAGVGQVQKLRDMATLSVPLSLSRTSNGNSEQLLGNWCITRITENQSSLLNDGTPRSQEFTLEFTRYGDDL